MMRFFSSAARRRRAIKLMVVTAVLFVLVVIVPAMTLAPIAPAWAPEPVRLWAYDTRLFIGRPITTVSSLAQAVKNEPAFYVNEAGETVTFMSDGLEIVATLYGVDDGADDGAATQQPAVLLLHGSSPQGRKLGLYPLLGRELARQGYIVLAIDQRGYGQSDDPPDVSRAESFDFVGDVRRAVDYLSGLPVVDPDEIYLIGHSFGADVAVTAVSQQLPINKLVVIGPGRRFIERGGTETAPETGYFARREMR